jgi:hypothetical protein
LADFSGKSSKISADIDTDIFFKFRLILIKLNQKNAINKRAESFSQRPNFMFTSAWIILKRVGNSGRMASNKQMQANFTTGLY